MPEKVTVKQDYHNSRFDRWFKVNIIDLPQSLIQKILRLNKVKINRKKVKSSYRVQSGDIVEIYDISRFKISDRPKIIKYKPSRKEVDLYDDYILIFQLAGLVLLVAMIGAIVLTLRHRVDVERQDVVAQMMRDPAKAMELKDVKPGQGL